jgi:hypothetical protein
MDHVVFVSRAFREMDRLLSGDRTMIIRGSLGRRLPYGKVGPGDTLFFATGNGRNVVKATAGVQHVLEAQKLSEEEASALLERYKGQLSLADAEADKWSRKKYLTLVEIDRVSPVVPFTIDARGDEDDWLALDDIDAVIK